MNTVQRSPSRAGAVEAMAYGNELGILAADFKNGVNLARLLAFFQRGAGAVLHEFLVHENRAGLVRGDLVVDRVRANQFADKFASGSGGAYASHHNPVPEQAIDFLQAFLD